MTAIDGLSGKAGVCGSAAADRTRASEDVRAAVAAGSGRGDACGDCGWFARPGIGAGQPQSQPADRQHGFGAIGHLQGLQDRGNVILDGRLRQLERAADRLVALALHHQGKHFCLTPGQPECRRRVWRPACGWICFGHRKLRQVGKPSYLRTKTKASI
jgi:hypothetical protein